MAEATLRSVVVTGGATGIGRAVAERLARGGAAVTAIDQRSAELETMTAELAAVGITVTRAVADVTDASDVSAVIDAAAERQGGLDALVNSAGIQSYGTVETTPEEIWDTTLSTNLKSMFLTCRAAVPHLRRRGGGTIVNVASVQGAAAQANVVAYSASKGGIIALTRAMAIDHARDGIRVNSVSPGSVDTPMLRAAAERVAPGAAEDVLAGWGEGHPVGRVGRPEDVAGLVAYLVSSEATFVTGVDIRVDGGLLAAIALRAPRA